MQNVKKFTKKYYIFVVFSAFLMGLGCDYKDSPEITKTVSKLSDQLESGGKIIKDQASEELQKLYTIEYKVLKIDKDLSSEDLQNKLNELGKDRWDCTLVSGGDLMFDNFVCKRIPLSYLRFLPYAFR